MRACDPAMIYHNIGTCVKQPLVRQRRGITVALPSLHVAGVVFAAGVVDEEPLHPRLVDDGPVEAVRAQQGRVVTAELRKGRFEI